MGRRRISTGVVQRFCKPKVAGSNPASGTISQYRIASNAMFQLQAKLQDLAKNSHLTAPDQIHQSLPETASGPFLCLNVTAFLDYHWNAVKHVRNGRQLVPALPNDTDNDHRSISQS